MWLLWLLFCGVFRVWLLCLLFYGAVLSLRLADMQVAVYSGGAIAPLSVGGNKANDNDPKYYLNLTKKAVMSAHVSTECRWSVLACLVCGLCAGWCVYSTANRVRLY